MLVAGVQGFLGCGNLSIAPGRSGSLGADSKRSLLMFVLLERLPVVRGVVAKRLRQQPCAGQGQFRPAPGKRGGAMRGVADQHDASVVP